MVDNASGPTLKMVDDGESGHSPVGSARSNYNFKRFDLNQQLLIAPDLNDWLPADHLARAIAQTVGVMDASGDLDDFYAAYREDGQGAWSYDPKMMVGVVLYGWSVGVFTTRKIARAIETDVGFRYLAGNRFPDFRTIGRFLRVHEQALAGLFDVVLRMCMNAGMTKVGRVALDGRIVKGNASIDRNRSSDHIARQVKDTLDEMRRLEAEEDELFGDLRGDELPEELRDPTQRKRLLEEARKRLDTPAASRDQRLHSKLGNLVHTHDLLEEREQEWEDRIREEQQEKIDRWENRVGPNRGKRPMSPDEKVKGERQRRFQRRKQAPKTEDDRTSVESDAEWEDRIRREQQEKIDRRKEEEERTGKPPMGRPPLPPSDDWVQRQRRRKRKHQRKRQRAKESQDEDWFDRTSAKINLTDPDSRPMLGRKGWKQGYNDQSMVDTGSQVILATDTVSEVNDKGQLLPMLDRCKGSTEKYPDQTIIDSGYYSEAADEAASQHTDLFATTQKGWKTRKKLREQGAPRGRIPNSATRTERMERKLLTKRGRRMYTERYVVECVQGQLSNRGFDRFLRRNHKGARMESALWKATHNILKMFKAGKLPHAI